MPGAWSVAFPSYTSKLMMLMPLYCRLCYTLESSVGLNVQRVLKWSTESRDSVDKQIRVHGRKGTEEMAQLDG